jgi:hypothetical protein
MRQSNRVFASLMSLLFGCGFITALADDHIFVERARAGMGMQFPPRVSEIWLNETSVCTKGSRFITIERYDLGRRWILSRETKRYFDEPLAPPAEEKKEPVAIQRAGWDYEPSYDWTISESQKTDTVCGFICKLLAADAEVDYSSGSFQLWVAGNVPINVGRFNRRVVPLITEFDWKELSSAYPPLNNLFLLKYTGTQVNSIGPEMTFKTTVTKLENATPPAGTYDIPEGYQKVRSMEELTQ